MTIDRELGDIARDFTVFVLVCGARYTAKGSAVNSLVRRHPTHVCHPSTKFAGSVAPQILERGRPLPRAQCTTTVGHADAGGLTFILHGSMGMVVDIHAESGSLN